MKMQSMLVPSPYHPSSNKIHPMRSHAWYKESIYTENSNVWYAGVWYGTTKAKPPPNNQKRRNELIQPARNTPCPFQPSDMLYLSKALTGPAESTWSRDYQREPVEVRSGKMKRENKIDNEKERILGSSVHLLRAKGG